MKIQVTLFRMALAAILLFFSAAAPTLAKPARKTEQVKAVSSAPGSKSKAAPRSFDPLRMSDEEIMAVPSPF